jgi:hypothetical protein
MILMAATSVNDVTAAWKAKILLISRLIDILLTSRTIEGKENNYENLRDTSFNLAKIVRDQSAPNLLAYVRTEWPKYFIQLAQLTKLSYAKADKSDLLFLLARIAVYLEDELGVKSKTGFVTFWKRDRNQKTFDIEHLFKLSYDTKTLPATHGFSDEKDYLEQRNLLGALILLPRGRNRSLQDKSYKDKLPIYATENVLAQTLTSAFYGSNPDAAKFIAVRPLVALAAVADFEKASIATRGATYTTLAELIWASP